MFVNLENIIERAFIMCGAELIGIEHLPEELTAHQRPSMRIPA
jgi:DNA-binding NtrC family response regulator